MKQNALAAVHTVGKTPLDVMIAVMQHPGATLELQLEAARAAAPYCHPKLHAVQPMSGPEERSRPQISNSERARAILLVLAEAAASQ